jgi:cation transport ATPase
MFIFTIHSMHHRSKSSNIRPNILLSCVVMDNMSNNIGKQKAKQNAKHQAKRWYWLLVLPWVISLSIPFYNHIEPRFFGFPFFYWFQLLMVFVAALIIGIVYYKAHVQVAQKSASDLNKNDSEGAES